MPTKRTRNRVPVNAMALAETALVVVATRTTPKLPNPHTPSAHAARMEAALAVQARKESS